MMTDSDRPEGEPQPPVRQPGWVLLLGVLGIALIVVGLMMVLMINAPIVRWRTIIIGSVMLATGLVLLPLAWLLRNRGK